MVNNASFHDYSIIACGTLSLELNHLKDIGFLDANKILYTKPGLHQTPKKLEKQLIKQLGEAKNSSRKIIVVYGGKFCYVNTDNPYRNIDAIIEEQLESRLKITRIKATHCIDMLAGEQERTRIS
jgi:hypothetical protein